MRLLRERYPGVPVVTYVNTSAEVKAESDVCCTSANAVEVVESLGVARVIFLPDEYLGQVRGLADEASRSSSGRATARCTSASPARDLRRFAVRNRDVQILAHPECPPDVLAEADYVGSTAGMIRHVGEARPRRVVLVTECSMSDNVAVEFPDVEFVRPCNLCPHMKRITLPKILRSLQTLQHEVAGRPGGGGARRCAVERMLAVGRGEGE